MNVRTVTLMFLLMGSVCLLPRAAMGQNLIGFAPGHSDNPNGPTVSPYLNLLQNNTTGIPTYQTLVKPLVDQQAAINQQGAALQRLQGRIGQAESAAYNAPTSGRGTGHPSFFMNRSHFYTGLRR